MTAQDIIKSIRCEMFADRPSISEALKYVDMLAHGAGEDAIAVYTAVYVTLNTVANEIEKMERGDDSETSNH